LPTLVLAVQVCSFVFVKSMLANSRQILFLLSFLLVTIVQAQQPIDSLKKRLTEVPNDSSRVRVLNRLAWLLRSSDAAQAMEYAQEAQGLAKRVNDDRGLAESYNIIGVMHYRSGAFSQSINAHLQALRIRTKTGDKEGLSISYINLGNVYSDQNNNQLALNYYLKAADLISNELTNKSRLCIVYVNIGSIYLAQNENKQSAEFSIRARDEAHRIGDLSTEAFAWNNLGVAYEHQQLYDESFEAYNEAYQISEASGDKFAMVDASINMGNTCCHQKKYTQAIEWHKKAEAMAREIDYLEGLRVNYESFANDYAAMRNYEQAYLSHVRFKSLTDSLFNDENTARITELTLQFEVEKSKRELIEKKKELELAETAKKSRGTTFWLLVGFVFLALTAGVFLVVGWQKNKRLKEELAFSRQLLNRKNN
jgi:tetratricopeptide (TPR) repeat protein